MPDLPDIHHGFAGTAWRDDLENPFAVRGPHRDGDAYTVRTFLHGAEAVDLIDDAGNVIASMQSHGHGYFSGPVAQPYSYRLRIRWPGGEQITEDPYSFGPILTDEDLRLFADGRHWTMGERLGAVPDTYHGVDGVRFAVWAPNARRVSVVGDFNSWDGRRHPMRRRYEAGVWEIFIPRLGAGERYKYEIVGADGNILPLKADPIARATERPPATASIVAPALNHNWHDENWMAARAGRQGPDAPLAIYEVHAGSWQRPSATETGTLNWDGLIERLIPYVRILGFTHIELLPIMEHPFTGSWGYQPLSQFAPSARYGTPDDFARFVDACHQNGLGVILDWVPAHFPGDGHGLVRFDGTALYEHADPREGFHPDWNTYVYNLGRREVRGYLIASALWWLEHFHVDGIRVDAVASMLYRDYSRKAGEWVPNIYGGRENLEAVDFLQIFNKTVAERCPGAITLAEESTAWPGVTAPVAQGGLGFSYKWNMGWMHDTLHYMGRDPIHRRWHQNNLTFGLVYAFSERFVLPLSHDEVVYGKGSLYTRMPGDDWQKRANLRAYLAFMWTHPGKKLLFMGGEFASPAEWNHDSQLQWDLLQKDSHRGVQRLTGDLNTLYRSEPSLHRTDCDPAGFSWIIADDQENSVFAYVRMAPDAAPLVIAINMTPVPRHGYRIGVPAPGRWHEVLNTDAQIYGGSNCGNLGTLETTSTASHGYAQSLTLTLPPLAALALKPQF